MEQATDTMASNNLWIPPPAGDGDELRLVLGDVARELGRIVHVDRAVPGTAPGHRILMTTGNAGRVFLKSSDGTPFADAAVGAEAALLTEVRHKFMPRVLAAEPGADIPWMVLPDLSDASWAPPWPDDLRPVLKAQHSLAKAKPPRWLPEIKDFDPWDDVTADELPVHVAERLDDLRSAASKVSLGGRQLVHGDLGSGNFCTTPRRVVVTDWSDAHVGNADIDRLSLVVDLAADTGRRVDPGVADLPGWMAKTAGLLFGAAVRDPFPGLGGIEVRDQQWRLARVAADWALDLV